MNVDAANIVGETPITLEGVRHKSPKVSDAEASKVCERQRGQYRRRDPYHN